MSYFGFYAAGGQSLVSVTISAAGGGLYFGELGIAASCTLPTITQNPLDQTICESSTAFFFANATGFSTIQWQVSTDAGATWNNIVGATSLLYAIGAVPASYNGRMYRAVFDQGTPCAVTSTAATLTVWTAPTVTLHPVPVTQTLCEGATLTYTSAATSSPASTVQWQRSTDGGATFLDIICPVTLSGVNEVPANASPATGTMSGLFNSATNSLTLTVTFSGLMGPTTAAHIHAAPSGSNGPVIVPLAALPPGVTSGSFTTTVAIPPANVAALYSGGLYVNIHTVPFPGGEIRAQLSVSCSTTPTYSTPVTPSLAGSIYRAKWTNPCGISYSNSALLQTVNTLPVVTTDPTNQTVCAPNTATFTSAATGSPAPTVQWQLSTDAGATWNPIGGATSPSYTTPATTASMNGYQYRAAWTNTCGTVNSAAAILTVNTAPVVATNPTNQTVCITTPATFTAAASGSPTPTVQWQLSTDGGSTFNNIGGATSTSYTTPPTSLAMNGYQYRAVFTNVCGTATTTAAILSTNASATTTDPVPLNPVVCAPTTVTFTVTIGGAPTPSVQWQLSTDGGTTWNNIGGATSTSYTTPATTTAMSGYQYRAVVSNACATATSNATTLTVNQAPIITTNPTNQTVSEGTVISLIAAATGTPTPTLQWQRSTDGGSTWQNMSGATTSPYTFAPVAAENGHQYRAQFTNSCGTTNTTAALLTVSTTCKYYVGSASSANALEINPTTFAVIRTIPITLSGYTVTGINGMSNHPTTKETFAIVKVSSQTARLLVRVDLVTGVATLVGNTGDEFAGIAFRSTGVLYGVTGDGASTPEALYTLNTSTGAATFVRNFGNGSDGETIGFNTTDGLMYHASGLGTRVWESYNVSTDVLTNIPITGDNSGEMGSLHYVGGNAFLAGKTFSSSGQMYRIMSNGERVLLASTSLGRVKGIVSVCCTPSDNPVITSNPASQTVCTPSTATFTSSATGTPPPGVQWQLSTDGGSTWNNISGATSTSYTTPATTTAMNGYRYRAVWTNVCNSATSSVAILTVNEPPTVTLHPQSGTWCPGSIATFTAAATGTAPISVQWQLSADGGVTWTNIAGATSTTLNFGPIGAGHAGNLIRAVFTNVCAPGPVPPGGVASNNATINLGFPPTVTQHPSNLTVCAGGGGSGTSTYSICTTAGLVNMSTTCSPNSYYNGCSSGSSGVTWVDNIPAGATILSVQVEFAVGVECNSMTYPTTLNGGSGPTFSTVFNCVCDGLPAQVKSLSMNPANYIIGGTNTFLVNGITSCWGLRQDATLGGCYARVTVTYSTSASFTAAATGTAPITVQWQQSTNSGATWTNISGATSTTLSITPTASMNGYQYRAVFTNGCGSATTNAATLTVNTPPTVTQNPVSQSNICVNSTVSLTAAATGTPTPTVQWQSSTNSGSTWSNISGATSTTYSFTFLNSHHNNWFRAVFTNTCGTATTTHAVTTKELTPPTVTCPANITVSNAINQCGANVSFAASATDNCPGPITLSYSPPSGSFFPVGVTTVTCTATDQALNTSTCTFTVRVNDTQFPTISGIAPIVASTDPNVCYRLRANTNLGAVTASDNCPGVTLSNNAPVQFPKGTTIVTWTATDASGNVTTATQSVTINDTQPPTITAPAALTLPTDLGVCSRWLGNTNLGVPTVADNCPGVTYVHNAPATFPLGTTTVTWTATDASGNTATATQTVTIVDTERPYITFNPTPAILVPANQTMRGIAANVYHFDNCPNYTWRLLSIISSEADAGLFPGDLPNDIQASIGTPTQSFSLRAERAGLSRMYWITYSITDAVNLSYQTTRAVVVPYSPKEEVATVPSEFVLEQNYPNPFNPSTMIRYAVPEDATVTLKVYNILGEAVAELVNGEVKAGYHEALFDATGLASGSYVYRLTATMQSGEKHTASKTLVVAK